MTERQRRFCEEYARCGNAAEAARRAGYSEKRARQRGSELLNSSDVRETIRDIQDKKSDIVAQIQAEEILSKDEILFKFSEIAENSDEKTSDRLRALEMLGKFYGLFVDKIEADVETGGVVILPEIMD